MKKKVLTLLLVIGITSAAFAQSNAADLARTLGNGATASGNTVTVTRGTGVQRNLTVPAGVTLDLTEDGGLWLHNNITLTVNGTVNTPSNRIGMDSRARSATINGNGTINLKSKGRLLYIGEGKKLTLDGVRLVGITDNDSSLVTVEGGEFVLISGVITGNAYEGNSGKGGGVQVRRSGTFIMEGGAISGNRAGIGGGVSVGDDGDVATFSMKGGTISGNSSNRFGGGGVRVMGQGTTFTMSGGTISGNTAREEGGGVAADRRSIFTMTGGAISGNSAENGAGVAVALGTIFTMEGGVVSGNISTHRAGGGGVLVGDQATFIMKGGTIYGSSAEGGNANTAPLDAALRVYSSATTVKWGTGGTYTKGGVPQTGGSDITSTNDTLVAVPGR